jgi:hypothetical protein
MEQLQSAQQLLKGSGFPIMKVCRVQGVVFALDSWKGPQRAPGSTAAAGQRAVRRPRRRPTNGSAQITVAARLSDQLCFSVFFVFIWFSGAFCFL